MATEAEHVKKSVRVYLFVFGALAVLTVATVAASWIQLSMAAAIALAMLIACVKGTLVASFFMHLTSERAVLYWVLALCVVFFAALVLLPVLQTSETAGLIEQVQ